MGTRAVDRERLRFRSSATGRWSILFRRQSRVLDSKHRGIAALAERLRPNALLLSLAAQENEPITWPAWAWLARQVHLARNLHHPQAHLWALDTLVTSTELDLVRQLVAQADLGISECGACR